MSGRHDRLVKTLTTARYKTIVVVLIAMAFAFGVIGASSSLVCHRATESKRLKIASCTVALTALTPFGGEEYKRASLYAQRGIARADLGRLDAAGRDLETALDKATFGDPRLVLKGRGIMDAWKWVPMEMLERMRALDPQSPAAQIWAEILAPYQPITLTR